MEENNLAKMEDILESTTRLIANIASYKIKYTEIDNFMKNIKRSISDISLSTFSVPLPPSSLSRIANAASSLN